MPGKDNGIVNKDGCRMRNWWDLFLDFNAFVEKGRSLWDCTQPTPTPTMVPVPTAVPTAVPELLPSRILWPQDGQSLDLESAYRFIAEKAVGATGYEWKIEQNGSVLHSQEKDALSGNEFRLNQDAPEHDNFKVGPLSIFVRVIYPYGNSEWSTATYNLRSRFPAIKKYVLSPNIGTGSGYVSVKKYSIDQNNAQVIVYWGVLEGMVASDRYQIFICSSNLGKCKSTGALKEMVGGNGVAKFGVGSFMLPRGVEYDEIKVWSVGDNSRCPYEDYQSPACLSGN